MQTEPEGFQSVTSHTQPFRPIGIGALPADLLAAYNGACWLSVQLQQVLIIMGGGDSEPHEGLQKEAVRILKHICRELRPCELAVTAVVGDLRGTGPHVYGFVSAATAHQAALEASYQLLYRIASEADWHAGARFRVDYYVRDRIPLRFPEEEVESNIVKLCDWCRSLLAWNAGGFFGFCESLPCLCEVEVKQALRDRQEATRQRELLAAATTNRRGQTDSGADKGTKKTCTDSAVLQLVKKLQKELPNGDSMIAIARDFTEGNEKKAQTLLRKIRRYQMLN